MSQNIILTQALNYLINKRASLELKSHWNNISMTSSIHMSHSLFCFVFIENEDVALSSGISNELRYNNYFYLHKTIMVTQLQDILCKIASQGKAFLRQCLFVEMKNAAKFSLMPATVCVMKKSKIFYALLYFFSSTVSLSFFRFLSAGYCMPVCLCARLCRDQLLRTFDIRYSEWSLVQVFQRF